MLLLYIYYATKMPKHNVSRSVFATTNVKQTLFVCIAKKEVLACSQVDT